MKEGKTGGKRFMYRYVVKRKSGVILRQDQEENREKGRPQLVTLETPWLGVGGKRSLEARTRKYQRKKKISLRAGCEKI